ncbi:MAG TPA: beta-N-acetylhexosaminidase [Bacteroidetes bacterium]|nr:beta-N-acetylhexosaminidase [Bacteroidota bacterium]
MSNYFTLFFLILLIISTKCKKLPDGSAVGKIRVEWELVSNVDNHTQGALACFTITNLDTTILGSSGWALYFNMAPRMIIPVSDTVQADVQHINGDWYKLVPRNGFNLSSGESIDIYYTFRGCYLKESDVPQGLYFVLYNEEGEQEDITVVNDYGVKPFVRSGQLRCSPNDPSPLPWASARYREYAGMKPDPAQEPMPLIPSPVICHIGNNRFSLDSSWLIRFDKGLDFEAVYLQQKLKDLVGIELTVTDRQAIAGSVIDLKNTSVTISGNTDESYLLNMDNGAISIQGTPAGVFYGIQSLLGLIPFSACREKGGTVSFAETTIEDAPRFAYRGLHIDICRNFQTRDQLLKVIDLMSLYKLNRLHLYLTEDEGWRVQINALPELTEVGSCRGHPAKEPECLPPAYGSGPFPDAPGNHGTGYYSQEEFKEIIRYAHDRHIQVIPSINLPGHARAAIRAMEVRYRRLKEEGKLEEAEEYRLIDPEEKSMYRSAQFYDDNVVNVARESVYHFFETVVDEVIAMYREAGVPLDMIHTGGDEVPDGVWTDSPLCDTLLARLPGVSDPKNLQNYFFRRIVRILEERGLKTGGWEEVALTRLEDGTYSVNEEFNRGNVILYIWNNLRGSEDLGYRMANRGYPVVLCPATNIYFDLAYDPHPKEPGLYWAGYNNELDAWELAPFHMIPENNYGLEKLETRGRLNILGLQAELWHETIRGGEMMEYYLLPKLIAFAERSWAQMPDWEIPSAKQNTQAVKKHQWQQFLSTLYQEDLPKLSFLNGGYAYRVPPPGAVIRNGFLDAGMPCDGFSIHYTTDGSEPTTASDKFTGGIPLRDTILLKAFDLAGRGSRCVTITPHFPEGRK